MTYDATQKQKAHDKVSRIPVKVVAAERLKKPEWIRVKAAPAGSRFYDIKRILQECKPSPDRPKPGIDLRPCYRIVFPDTIKHPDGTTAVATDAEDFAKQALAWRKAHPAAVGITVVKLPFTIINRDSVTVVIKTVEDLAKANAKCASIDPTPCFDVVFPAKVKLPSGLIVEVRSADAMKDLIERWIKNNPLSTDRPELVFPYRVKTRDGKTVIIKEKDDFKKLLANCR